MYVGRRKFSFSVYESEKVYVRTDRDVTCWKVSAMKRLKGNLLNGIKNFIQKKKTHLRVCKQLSDCFTAKLNLHQGSVMSQCGLCD